MSKIIENYILSEVIGEGQYGKVYKATHKKQENSVYAVKTIKVDKFKTVPKLNQFTINEIQTLEKIKHVNIVGFVEMLRSTNNVYLVYEYCQGGTLEDKMKQLNINTQQTKGIQINSKTPVPVQQHVGIKNNTFYMSEQNSLLFFVQLVKAFNILSSKNILHRDLKPQNILFDIHDNIKLADFGFCKTLPNKNSMTRTMVGSPIYMSPELLKGQPYNTKSDIWSLGVVLFEMLFGYCPFEDKTIALLIQKINNSKLQLPLQRNQISKECQQLLYQLLTQDPRQRIDWNQLMSYPFLQPYFEKAKLKEQQHTQYHQKLAEQEQQKKENKLKQDQKDQDTKLQNQKENQQPVLQEITEKVQSQQQQHQNNTNDKTTAPQQALQPKKDISNNENININITTQHQNQEKPVKQNQPQIQISNPQNINQCRSQILYQIRVINDLVQKDFHPLAPVIGFISLINIQQQYQKNQQIFSKDELDKFQEIIIFYQSECQKLCESNTLYKHDQEFKQIIKTISQYQPSHNTQDIIEIFKKAQPFYKKKTLEYIDYLQKNNKSDQKQLLVHLNEVLDCLLIEKLYQTQQNTENKTEQENQQQQMILNENLGQHENQYLQELLTNKIQFAQVLKTN